MISKQPVVVTRNQALVIITGLSGYGKYSVVFVVAGCIRSKHVSTVKIHCPFTSRKFFSDRPMIW